MSLSSGKICLNDPFFSGRRCARFAFSCVCFPARGSLSYFYKSSEEAWLRVKRKWVRAMVSESVLHAGGIRIARGILGPTRLAICAASYRALPWLPNIHLYDLFLWFAGCVVKAQSQRACKKVSCLMSWLPPGVR